MAGRGRPPKPADVRVNRVAPTRGDYVQVAKVGWQHGETPEPPEGMKPASIDAWRLWFAAWYAAHWNVEDVPALRHLVLLYDQVERGEFQRAGELRLGLDTWGVSPKGQQDRRWEAPKAPEVGAGSAPPPASRERRLRAV